MFGFRNVSFQESGDFIPTELEPQTPDELWLAYVTEDYLSGKLSADEVLTLILESAP